MTASDRRVKAVSKYLGDLLDHPQRKVEYGFVLDNLSLERKKALDVGCLGSNLADFLYLYGYDVWGIDVRNPVDGGGKPYNVVRGDIRATGFPDGFFDLITCISTLEHVGLKGYGFPERDDELEGDIAALREMMRVLKAGGVLIVTVPMGAPFTIRYEGDHETRYYGEEDLKSLLHGLNYTVKIDKGNPSLALIRVVK